MVVREAVVIDDNPARREFVTSLLQEQSIEAWALDPGGAAKFPESADVDAVLVGGCDDVKRVVEEVRHRYPDCSIYYLEHSDDAKVATRKTDGSTGDAFHDAVVDVVNRGRRFKSAPKPRRSPELFRCLVGASSALQEVKRAILQVADADASVLLLGDSGTGKEVVARNIHYHSPRRGKPFVPINCGAIPAELLESELFGHEKGAFTGAISARRGRFEMADGGTLFLDEIGDMPMSMQVKLLRVLQERTFERVGSEKTIHADVRIVAATHRDLEQQIRDGEFREDLYFRLCVFPITVPPLRQRVEDLPLLIKDISHRLREERNSSIELTDSALKALGQYRWPGNVRELANVIERLVIMYPNKTVDVGDLPEKYRQHWQGDLSRAAITIDVEAQPGVVSAAPAELPAEGLDLKQHLAQVERSLIEQALTRADGVVAHAADILNVRRTTLVEKIRKYGINDDGDRQEFDELSAANG